MESPEETRNNEMLLDMTEKPVQSDALKRLSATPGITVFRNNVGVAVHEDGSRTRYGLCVGSSDIIGWESKVITQADVGSKVAVFLAVECKAPGKRPTPEQQRFLDAVTAAGGIAYVEDGRKST